MQKVMAGAAMAVRGGALTLAGVSVALHRRTPRQVVVQVSTALAVDACRLMLAVTLGIDLHTNETHLNKDAHVQRADRSPSGPQHIWI